MAEVDVQVALSPALSVNVALASSISVPVTLAPAAIIAVDVAVTGPRGQQGEQGETGIQGEQGLQGLTGADGSAATVDVGTVTTGAAGSSASIINSGTSSAAILDFTIPKGDKGDAGATGSTGAKGDTGNAATIAVGTVTTGDAGTAATVTNAGTANAAVFDFTIPKGTDGTGTGDMEASTYDPNSVAADAFDMDNMVQGGTNKFVTVAEKDILDNTSGVNTGDQDLSGYVKKTDSSISGAGWLSASVNTSTDKAVSPNAVKGYVDTNTVPVTRTVAGHALSADVTVGAADLTASGISSTKFLRGDNTWQVPTNTTYSAMSVAEGETGTATTSRAVRADYLEQIIQYHVQQALLAMNDGATYGWQ